MQAIFADAEVRGSQALQNLLLMAGVPLACGLPPHLADQLLKQTQGTHIITPSIVRRKLFDSLSDPNSRISHYLANWDPAGVKPVASEGSAVVAIGSLARTSSGSSGAAAKLGPVHPAAILLQYCMQDLSKVLQAGSSVAQLPASSAEAFALCELDGLALLPMADGSLATLSFTLTRGGMAQVGASAAGRQHSSATQLLFLQSGDEFKLLKGVEGHGVQGMFFAPDLPYFMNMLVQQLVNTGACTQLFHLC